MAKKCPPGVICIENATMLFIIISLFIIIAFAYFNIKKIFVKEPVSIDVDITTPHQQKMTPNYPYNNIPRNVLTDPYRPPLKDDRYIMNGNNYITPNNIPINVSTNIGAVDTTYRQVGILTPLNEPNKDNILALMGRPLFTNRDKWQYYTISNQHNNVKLPISVKGKSALTDYGVDQVYTGDTVYVEGYNDAFTVTQYDNDTIKYIPFL